jgi:hypothetical protein
MPLLHTIFEIIPFQQTCKTLQNIPERIATFAERLQNVLTFQERLRPNQGIQHSSQ